MKRILRAFACIAVLATVAAAAQAQVGLYFGVRAPVVVVAVPPCPGVGYIWTPGYYAGAGWIPGRWVYGGGYGHPYFYRNGDHRSYAYRGDDRRDMRADNRSGGHDRGYGRR